REHPIELPDALDPILRVHGEDNLGIRGRPKRVPQLDELGPKLDVVIDLAVEDDRIRPGRHRLMTGLEVDDRQPLEPEPDAPCDEHAVGIRPTMPDEVGHGRDLARVDGRAVAMNDPDYATHKSITRSGSREEMARAWVLIFTRSKWSLSTRKTR